MKYSIEDLKEIHFQSLTKGTGNSKGPRASIIFHNNRPSKAIGRNDFVVSQLMLTEFEVGNTEKIAIMCANFPKKKMQVVFNPKNLAGPSKFVNIRKTGGGVSFGMGALVQQFALENGFEVAKEKNYFACDLSTEVTFKDGKMVVVEFTIDPEVPVIYEFRK